MPGSSNLLPLAVALPILAAAVLLPGTKLPRLALDSTATAAAAAVAGINAAILVQASHTGRVVMWAGGWQPSRGFSVGVSFVADPLNAGLALIASALVTAGLLYSWRYYDSVHSHLHVLMLLFLAGMEGFALSGDLFDMFVFFELMGAAAYALTGYKVEDAMSLQGAINFGVINSLGAYLSLAGVALVYSRTGQLGLSELHTAVAHHRPDALIIAGFVMVSCGFLVKAAMAPFHFWLADAHAVAPAPVCILFSGVMVELGVYGFARAYMQVFSGSVPVADVRRAFIVMGLLTAAVGATMCVWQRHLKRLLAYSTIAHIGLFLMAVAAFTPDGVAGAAVYIAGHAGIKAALFLIAGVVLNRYQSVDEHALIGRGRDDMFTGALFLLGGVALSGLPPFGVALGKSLAEEAVSKSGYPFGPAVFVAVSALTGGAVIRAGLRIWLGAGRAPSRARGEPSTPGEEEPEAQRLVGYPPTMFLPIIVLLGGALAVGLLPGAAQLIGHAAERFTDPAGYAAQALGGGGPSPVHDLPDMGWSASGLALALTSVAGAVLVALLGLFGSALPARVRDAAGVAGRALGPLRRAHSGHIGDYAAWLVFGLSFLAALVGLPLR